MDRERRFLAYAGKLTWQLGSDHRIDLSAFGDPGRGEEGPQRSTALLAEETDRFSALRYGGHNQVVKYDAVLKPTWLIEVMVGRTRNRIEELPSADERRVVDFTVVPIQRAGGLGQYELGNESENRQLSLKSTHLFEAAGSHQLRYGSSSSASATTTRSRAPGRRSPSRTASSR